ncbi:MAG: ABC transporter permease [Patescibacteria group bacterium]|nr:ABC transporter permease [Patescibacteria group bacterium]
MRTLKNVFRKKIRALLTIFGIVIGVFSLVVMGAMAEKMTLLVGGGTKFYKDKITITAGDYSSIMTSPLSIEKLDQLRKVEGVKEVSGGVTMILDKELSSVQMGVPAMIEGNDGKGRELDRKDFPMIMAKGRELRDDDIGKAVVGIDLVKKLNADIGKKIKVRDKEFEVVGIRDKTFTIPDTTVRIPFAESQKMFVETLPEVLRANIDPSKVITGATVYAADGVNADDLAKKIESSVKGIKATGPKKFQEQVTSAVAIFNAIIFGIAMISLLVGGLSVINTMTMSISERTREIGIRKAIGASNNKIIKQFLAESAMIGLIGGSIGLFLGWVFVTIANAAGNESGTALFLITPRLAIGSVAFAAFLGIISGLIPAWHAARMNPVQALRYE